MIPASPVFPPGAGRPQRLAVVISAFKPQYLAATLDSLAAQTEPDFDVFVGDDGGPPEIERICAGHADRLRLRYHRFTTNLGGISLARQWDRCLAMTSQPWLMLLGDDDLLDRECVARFYAALDAASRDSPPALYRFDTRIVDREGRVVRENPPHPRRVSALEFVAARFAGGSSYVVEMVFSRAAYEKIPGFVHFPLAWCSDDATWALLSREGGIECVPGAKVSWRLSGDNISSPDARLTPIKIASNLDYLDWLRREFLPLCGAQADEVARLRRAGVEWFYSTAGAMGAAFGLASIPGYARRLARFGNTAVAPQALRLARMKIDVGSG